MYHIMNSALRCAGSVMLVGVSGATRGGTCFFAGSPWASRQCRTLACQLDTTVPLSNMSLTHTWSPGWRCGMSHGLCRFWTLHFCYPHLCIDIYKSMYVCHPWTGVCISWQWTQKCNFLISVFICCSYMYFTHLFRFAHYGITTLFLQLLHINSLAEHCCRLCPLASPHLLHCVCLSCCAFLSVCLPILRFTCFERALPRVHTVELRVGDIRSKVYFKHFLLLLHLLTLSSCVNCFL